MSGVKSRRDRTLIDSDCVDVEQPLEDRTNTVCEDVQEMLGFQTVGSASSHSLGAALSHLKTCASNAHLLIHDVPGVGNCMYHAILYQLESNGACSASVTELKEMTASYLEKHSDFYSQFVSASIPSSKCDECSH